MERAQRGVWRQCGITWHCNQMKYAARTEFLINDSPGEAVHVVPCVIPPGRASQCQLDQTASTDQDTGVGCSSAPRG